MLASVLVVAVMATYLGMRLRAAAAQQRAVSTFRSIECEVYYDYEVEYLEAMRLNSNETSHEIEARIRKEATPHGPLVLRRIVGDDFFNDVKEVYLAPYNSDEVIGAQHVELLLNCKGLEELAVANAKLTTGDLDNIASIGTLKYLTLADALSQGASLTALNALSSLERLDLSDNQLRTQDVAKLNHLTELRELLVAGTPCDDELLNFISIWPRLELLDIRDTKITKERVHEFQLAHPQLKLDHDFPDLRAR